MMKDETGKISKVPIKKDIYKPFQKLDNILYWGHWKIIEGDMAAYNPDMVLEKLLSLQGKE